MEVFLSISTHVINLIKSVDECPYTGKAAQDKKESLGPVYNELVESTWSR